MVNDVGFHVLPMLERERVAEDELDGDHPSWPLCAVAACKPSPGPRHSWAAWTMVPASPNASYLAAAGHLSPRLSFMRTTQTGSRGIRPAQSLSHDAQAFPCEWEYLVPAVTTHDDGRATDVDVHSWMSHQKQLDDRQRPSATIGNSHRQRPCHSPGNDRRCSR